ncbi:RDD family protein [Candidatus Woesearchaeota archaeon]|nr:RDD family protein [Candidatus Woesearchaeota archaeon]
MYAGNFRRIFAFFLDLAVVDLIITRPLSKLISDDFNELSDFLSISFEIVFISLLIGIFAILYWSILEYKIGQTLGALVFGLRARSLNKGMSFPQAVLRNVTKINVALLLIDSVNILFSEKKQRYFEVMSKTITLEER